MVSRASRREDEESRQFSSITLSFLALSLCIYPIRLTPAANAQVIETATTLPNASNLAVQTQLHLPISPKLGESASLTFPREHRQCHP